MPSFEEALLKLRKYRKDPVAFVTEQFGVTLDSWQKNVLLASADPKNNRIAMKACKGVGKTAVEAFICWWYVATHHNAQICVLAPSADHLKAFLWKELATWYGRSELLQACFEMGKTRINLRPSQALPGGDQAHWIEQRSFGKDADEASVMQSLAGFHAINGAWVIDECGDMPSAVLTGAEGLLTGAHEGHKFILMAGNPSHRSGPLWEACMIEPQRWFIQTINSIPGHPERSTRVSEAEAQAMIDRYGWDDPRTRTNIRGEFPDANNSGMYEDSLIQQAMDRYLESHAYDFEAKIIGVDTAREGGDSTVLFPRQGRCAFEPVELTNNKTQDIVAAVSAAYYKWGADAVIFDGTGGYSAGAYDECMRLGINCFYVPFNSTPFDKRFRDKKTEMAFALKDWLPGGCLPTHATLRKEMSAAAIEPEGDRMKMIKKSVMKKELSGASPNFFDGLILTFAFPNLRPLPKQEALTQPRKSDFHFMKKGV